jgi:hypothetical protein
VGLPFVAVNYTNLVRTPQSTVADICLAIGMPYFEGKERFWEKKHHYLFGSSGVRRQVETGNSTIEAEKAFPPEFQAQVEILRRQVAADSEVQHILGILRQADVKLIASDGSLKPGIPPKKPWPLWYYRKRTRQRFLRYFPQAFDPTAT